MLKKIAAMTLLSLMPHFANATLLRVDILDDGALMGFNNIDVDGVLYDVRFIDGKYDVLGNDLSGFDNFTDAEKANKSLAATFSAIPEYKNNPGIINGCSTTNNNITCWIETAYMLVDEFVSDPFFDPNDISYKQVLAADMAITTHSNPFTTDYNLSQNRDLSLDRGFVWANWTQSEINSVPEPSTFTIFALGLMGLVSRRIKKQA
jgi:hypothetical protein